MVCIEVAKTESLPCGYEVMMFNFNENLLSLVYQCVYMVILALGSFPFCV